MSDGNENISLVYLTILIVLMFTSCAQILFSWCVTNITFIERDCLFESYRITWEDNIHILKGIIMVWFEVKYAMLSRSASDNIHRKVKDSFFIDLFRFPSSRLKIQSSLLWQTIVFCWETKKCNTNQVLIILFKYNSISTMTVKRWLGAFSQASVFIKGHISCCTEEPPCL